MKGELWSLLSGDVQVAKLIYEDGIDILVDLTGHTGNNRLGVFARKPAQVPLNKGIRHKVYDNIHMG